MAPPPEPDAAGVTLDAGQCPPLAFVSSGYTAIQTALLAATYGSSLAHSSNWKHSSFNVQSNDGQRSATWSMSPFCPTDRPASCAHRATARLYVSWSSAVSG